MSRSSAQSPAIDEAKPDLRAVAESIGVGVLVADWPHLKEMWFR